MAQERVQRRLAAILVADVAGYSRLMGRDEEGTLAALTGHRRELIDPCIAEHRGRIVKTTGDGLLAEFASVVDAVRCAAAVQDGMAERNASEPDDRRIQFRIGVNLGDVIVQDDDVFGDGVNVAARLEGLAEPGGVVVSGTVHEHVRAKLDLAFDDLGPQQVKNIAESVRAFRLRSGTGVQASADAPLALPDKPSIAVLPFVNMSGEAEQEFFSDGITEDILTAISRIRQFFVIARNTMFVYKGQAVDVSAVARELGVRYVLEGSVRKAGNRVRITAQLIDGATGNHLWAERYDRNLDDIFAVQDDITQSIVAELEPELSRAEYERVKSKPPESLDAWELYHRGMLHYGRWKGDDSRRAREFFERAAARDPGFARAYAGIAWSYVQDAFFGLIDHDRMRAIENGKKAVELDDKDSFAHMALGRAYHWAGSRAEAVDELELAVRLNPSSAQAHNLLGIALYYAGRAEEAISPMLLSVRLSPSDPEIGIFFSRLAGAYFQLKNYEQTIEWARKAVQRANLWAPQAYLTAALIRRGRHDAAIEARKALEMAQPGITAEFVSQSFIAHHPSMNEILSSLREAGLPE